MPGEPRACASLASISHTRPLNLMALSLALLHDYHYARYGLTFWVTSVGETLGHCCAAEFVSHLSKAIYLRVSLAHLNPENLVRCRCALAQCWRGYSHY